MFEILIALIVGALLGNGDRVYKWYKERRKGNDSMRIPVALFALPALLAFQLFSPVLYAQATCAADADCITIAYAMKYTDDTSINAADIDGAEFEYKLSTATTWQTLGKLTYPATTYTRQPVAPGTNVYRARQLMKSGAFSAWVQSNSVITLPPPAAPTLRVADAKAYKPNLGYMDQMKVTHVGFVPIGTKCDAFKYADYNLVPLGKRTTVNGIRTSPLLRNEAGELVSVPMQVLALCKVS